MNFDIDIAIVIVFLGLTLVVGLGHGGKVKNIKDYALGGRNFSTATLVCTVVATWAAGDDFFIFISEAYESGLYFIVSYTLGILSVLLITGFVFIPRMGEFIGNLSIAESMGKLYGDKVKLITAIAGCIGTSGMIASQFKIAGLLFEYSLGIQSFYGTILGALIVTSYSSFGGIKSVTFTDVMQFFMFGAIFPTLAFFIFGTLSSGTQMIEVLSSNSNFDYQEVFNFSHSKPLYYLFLFFFVAIPSFDPAIFQRISMAKDTFQAKKAFIIAAFTYAFFGIVISWIGVVSLVIYPNLAPNEVAKHIITDYSYVGLKGLTLAGILAMMMSTADSYINSTSVLFTHDFCKAAGIKIKNELFTSRIVSFVLGSFSLMLALNSTNLLKLIITTKSFYMPIVSVPFMFSIFGFRSSGKSVLIGMVGGFVTVVLWEIFLRNDTVDSVIPGMLANIIFLFASHYILKQPGGWVGIKNYEPVLLIRKERKKKISQLIYNIKNFNFIQFCVNNSPKKSDDSVFLYFGIFCIFSTYFSIYTMPQEAKIIHQDIINFIYPSVFFVSTLLISYPLWFSYFKNTKISSIVWITAIFYILICVGFSQVLISNFSKFQLMTFMLNFIVLAILVRWPVALFMIIIGLISSTYLFKWYSGTEVVVKNLDNMQFTIIYILLFMSAVLIAFFKPKQEHLEATEAKVDTLESEVTTLDHKNEDLNAELVDLNTKVTDLNDTVTQFSRRVADQEKEIERLGATAQKILNNVNHELRLPVGNVMNFAEMLHDGLGKFNEDQLKMISDEVFKNSNRLSSMIMNMLDLATLEAKKLELNKKTINLGELVEDRVKYCRKVYLEKKKIDFRLEIQPNVLIDVDPDYMRQVVDNLVINAIKFSKEGTINITLLKPSKFVEFTISDSGIGIPKNDLYDIFTPFKMGSNTESKAEGRGVGLALCKAAIEAHGGTISADSIGGKGAIFKFLL